MARGGKREGAGRKAGVPGKSKAKLIEAVTATGITPLQFLLSEMRDESLPRDDRMTAAIAAAPYVHSKMPTAIVTPAAPGVSVAEDDEHLLGLYLSGLHEEADAG
jgi:hypothetical protein